MRNAVTGASDPIGGPTLAEGLAARMRVDEASLRTRELDVLPKLLEKIKKAKQDDPALDL